MKILVNKFCEIAKKVNEEFLKNIETRVCPDILAGCNGKFYFSKQEREKVDILDLSTDINKEDKTIVIVLESPHIDEYLSDNKFGPTPAIGKTGTNLQKYFNHEKIFEKIERTDEYQNYRVILMNVIQYQCSLGVDTKIFRDDIFDGLLEDVDIVGDFVNRLKSYNPNVIFNGCTEGKNKIRRKKISKIIRDNFDNVILFEMNHPSCWERKKDGSFRNVNEVL